MNMRRMIKNLHLFITLLFVFDETVTLVLAVRKIVLLI